MEQPQENVLLLRASAGRRVFDDENLARPQQTLSETWDLAKLTGKVAMELATRGAYVARVDTVEGQPVITIRGVNDAYGREMLLRRVTLFNDTDKVVTVHQVGEDEYAVTFPEHFARLKRSLELLSPTELLEAAKDYRRQFRVQLSAVQRARSQSNANRDYIIELEGKLAEAQGRPDPYAPNEQGLYPDEE